MAKLGNIELKIDKFCTDTRMNICKNRGCKYLADDGNYCKLKVISLNQMGYCEMSEWKGKGKEII